MLSVIDRKLVEFRRAKEELSNDASGFIVALSLAVGVLSLGVLAPPAASAETAPPAEAKGPFAYVTVAGAPGDGEEALAAALSRQLAARGFIPATAFQANVYEVQGTVRVAPGAKGKREHHDHLGGARPRRHATRHHAPNQGCAQGLARQEMGACRQRCRGGSG